MPKVSVYVPDDLYDAVRRYDIAVPAVAQAALEAAVASEAHRIARARSRPLRRSTIDTATLLADVRDEFGA